MKTVFWACLWFLNFLPLWVAIAVGDAFRYLRGEELGGAVKWSLVGLAAGTVFSLVIVLRALRSYAKAPAIPVEVKKIKERKAASVELLMTYVLPLWAFNFTDWLGWIQFGIFFSVVVWLACRHLILEGCLCLEFLGYRVYKCELQECRGVQRPPADEYLVFCSKPLESLQGVGNVVPLSNQARLLLPGGES